MKINKYLPCLGMLIHKEFKNVSCQITDTLIKMRSTMNSDQRAEQLNYLRLISKMRFEK